jgi:hypothetical protein
MRKKKRRESKRRFIQRKEKGPRREQNGKERKILRVMNRRKILQRH